MPRDDQDSNPLVPAPIVKYVGFGQLILYLVSDQELLLIESGGPSATYLNLAIGFLSVGTGITVSLLLAGIPASVYKFSAVVILEVATLIAGTILLVLWKRSDKDAKHTIARIRARGSGPPIDGTVIK